MIWIILKSFTSQLIICFLKELPKVQRFFSTINKGR